MDDLHETTTPTTRNKVKKTLQLLFVLVLLGALAETVYQVSTTELAASKAPTAAQPDTRIEERLSYVEAHIQSLEQALANLPKTDATTQAAASPSENLMVEARLEELQNRMDALQKGTSAAQALQRVSLLTAYGQLQKTMRHGKPFARELSLLNGIAAGRLATLALLNNLQPYAEQPAPTTEALQQQFERAVTARMEGADDANSLLGNLHSLVRVRKEGMATGDDDDSVIARAEAALKSGNVESAAREISQLSASASGFFTGWLQSAQNYLKLEAALDALEADLMQPESAAQSAPAPAP